jgi:DNA-binding transcriptional MerR regulator
MPSDLTISEAARRTGLSIDTLRYYEREGLTPRIGRRGGQRRYAPSDLEWFAFVARMRGSGLPVALLRELTRLAARGDATLSERRAIVAAHRASIERDIARLVETLALVDEKLAFYDRALARIDTGDRRPEKDERPCRQSVTRP